MGNAVSAFVLGTQEDRGEFLFWVLSPAFFKLYRKLFGRKPFLLVFPLSVLLYGASALIDGVSC